MEVKHPVSQLQELMAQQHKELPLYQIADISTTVPSFHCVVQADTITGTGVALSKQAAKKEAARHALEQLGYTVNDATNSVTTSTKIISQEVVTTTTVNYNAVGKLNELVAQQRLPYPCYNENGTNECGEFVMTCKLLDHECQSCGSTKKIAKQLAAHSMLKLMEEKIVDVSHPEPSVINKDGISDEIVISKYRELTISDIPKITKKDTAEVKNINYDIHKEEKSYKNDVNTTRFFSMVCYVCLMLFQLLIYCWNGNEVEVESLDVANAVYNFDWILCDTEIQKAIVVIIQRSHRSLKLSAGKFAYLTLMTYMSILRASGSYYMVLRNVNE